MKRTTVFSALIVFGAATVGITSALDSWGGRIYLSRTGPDSISDRMPASIRRGSNVSGLDGSALELASQKRLLEDMKVVWQDKRVGVQLGTFLTKGDDGHAAYACDVYKQVTLSFVGEGVADSGEKATMEVTAPCEEDTDKNSLQMVWVPLTARPGVPAAEQDLKTQIVFKNIGADLPSQWLLQSVRLRRSEGETLADASMGAGAASEGASQAQPGSVSETANDLTVSGDEFRALVRKPVVIRW